MKTTHRLLISVLAALAGLLAPSCATVALAIDYYVRGPVGTVAHPVTGEATVCGADVTTAQGDDASADATNPLTPWLTLDGSFASTSLVAGDTVYVSGRVRMAGDYNDWCLRLDGIAGTINVKQWPGQPAAIIRGYKMPGGFEDGVTNSGGAALAQNKTLDGANLYWTTVASTSNNCYAITCDGANGKADLTESGLCTGIATVVYDYDLAGNIDSVGRRKSHLKGPLSTGVGVKVRGAWSSVANGGAATAYAVGDSVKDGGVTYICITANTSSGATLLTTDSAKWETYATQRTALLAQATSLQGAFCFDFQTAELLIRLPTGLTPANALANGVEYALCNKTGLYYSSTGGVFTHLNSTVSGIRFQGWGDEKSVAPYGTAVNMSFTSNAVIENCVAECSGDHAFAAGTKVDNFTIRNCTIIGGQAGCYFVVFNASGGAPAYSASGTFRDSVMYLNTWLGHNALTVGNSLGAPGVYVHGPHGVGGAGVTVDGVTFHHFVPASGTRDQMWPVNSDNGAAPSDVTHARNYPLYVKNCTETHGVGWATGGVTSYIGFENCSWRGDASYLLSTGERYMTMNGTGTWMFEGSTIAADIRNQNGGANTAVISVNGTSTVRLLNCSVYDFAASHSAAHNQGIFFYSATPNGTTGQGVFCSGSILGFRASDRAMRVCIGDAAFTTYHAFTDNVYFNCGYTAGVASDTWSAHADLDSAAEWAGLDTGAVNNLTVNPFVNTTTASDLSLTAAAKAVRKYITPHVLRGINGAGYGNNYGAWQYGGGTQRSRGAFSDTGTGDRNRTRPRRKLNRTRTRTKGHVPCFARSAAP